MSHQRERETLVCVQVLVHSNTETRLTAHTDTRLDQLVHRLSKTRNNRHVISASTKVKQVVVVFFAYLKSFLKCLKIHISILLIIDSCSPEKEPCVYSLPKEKKKSLIFSFLLKVMLAGGW